MTKRRKERAALKDVRDARFGQTIAQLADLKRMLAAVKPELSAFEYWVPENLESRRLEIQRMDSYLTVDVLYPTLEKDNPPDVRAVIRHYGQPEVILEGAFLVAQNSVMDFLLEPDLIEIKSAPPLTSPTSS